MLIFRLVCRIIQCVLVIAALYGSFWILFADMTGRLRSGKVVAIDRIEVDRSSPSTTPGKISDTAKYAYVEVELDAKPGLSSRLNKPGALEVVVKYGAIQQEEEKFKKHIVGKSIGLIMGKEGPFVLHRVSLMLYYCAVSMTIVTLLVSASISSFPDGKRSVLWKGSSPERNFGIGGLVLVIFAAFFVGFMRGGGHTVPVLYAWGTGFYGVFTIVFMAQSVFRARREKKRGRE